MTFSDVVREILTSAPQPMSPQEIRAVIKEKYPQYYGTQSHINNVEKGHYKDIEHALLAQIYTLVGTSDSFFCDKSQKPMRISLFSDQTEPTPSIEDFETDEGFVYVLTRHSRNQTGSS